MASIIRKGKTPFPPPGIGAEVGEIVTVSNGFLGDWAYVWRKRNPGHPKRVSSPDLIYRGIDTNRLSPSDEKDPMGVPMQLLKGDEANIYLSKRSDRMPYVTKDVDGHQIRFYHRGRFILETELGRLSVSQGDFVVIPRGVFFRETPLTRENSVLIFEVEQPVLPAERLWDKAGFSGLFIDYSLMELPVPDYDEKLETDQETLALVKHDNQYHEVVYDFDPTKDIIGWSGDPIIYKMSVWDIPGIGSTHGFLPPINNAVLYSEDLSFVFAVLRERPMPTVPAPKGSYGAPTHLNDYDEIWFNHAAELAPNTDGHLWLFPRTIPHPGLKKPPEYPPNPVREMREMKLNFDVRCKLRWTDEALRAELVDPQVSVYTSFYGAHVGVVPSEVLRYYKR
ncbi:MAG: hypothetical protein RMI78_05605 [Nitrososphaerota archaeon]|nr:hypothetical protein [Nitrososphaerota archaeon]